MDYINTGLIIGSISTIVCLILTLKRRWFKDNVLEDLYLWWDGKNHIGAGLLLSTLMLILHTILMPLIIALVWGAILPIGFIVFIVLKIRKRNINKNNRN